MLDHFNFALSKTVLLGLVFTMQCYASAVYAMTLCLSVTSQCSTKMAKCRNILTVSCNSQVYWSLVF